MIRGSGVALVDFYLGRMFLYQNTALLCSF